MYRDSTHAARARRQGLAARAAVAVLLGAGILASPAPRKDKKDSPAASANSNTKEFAAVYQPVADITNAPSGDLAAAKAQFPSVIAAIGNETDRFTAGQLELV